VTSPYSGTIIFRAAGFNGNGTLDGFATDIANLLPDSGSYTLNIGTTLGGTNMFTGVDPSLNPTNFNAVGGSTGTTVFVEFVFNNYTRSSTPSSFSITLN
jgi:hypothetical protein